MAGQASTGNVIAALASFFIPGLGQLLQGRLGIAIIQFCLAAVLWYFLLGWIIHLWSILDAACGSPRERQRPESPHPIHRRTAPKSAPLPNGRVAVEGHRP